MSFTISKWPNMNWIFLFFSEVVSKPVISWSCTNRTLICEVAKGSDPKLKLFLNETRIKESHQKVITHKWNSKWTASFNCMASNNVSAQKSTVTISCSGAWWALVRHPKFTSQTQPLRPTAEDRSRAWGLGLRGIPGSGWGLKTYLFSPEVFKGSLRGERR